MKDHIMWWFLWVTYKLSCLESTHICAFMNSYISETRIPFMFLLMTAFTQGGLSCFQVNSPHHKSKQFIQVYPLPTSQHTSAIHDAIIAQQRHKGQSELPSQFWSLWAMFSADHRSWIIPDQFTLMF